MGALERIFTSACSAARAVARSGLLALVAASASAPALAGCDHVATITVDQARVSRQGDGRLVVDVDVVAAEQSAKSVGRYCITMHVVPFGFDPETPGLRLYNGALERQEICGDDLFDGDTRTFRFVTARADILDQNPIRVQSELGRDVADSSLAEWP